MDKKGRHCKMTDRDSRRRPSPGLGRVCNARLFLHASGDVEGVDLGLGQVAAAGHAALVPGLRDPWRRVNQLLLQGPRKDGARVFAGLVGRAAAVRTFIGVVPLVDPVQEIADVLPPQLLDGRPT